MGARLLIIPEDVVASLRIPPDELEDELHKELALALYQRGMLYSGKAAALSGITRQQFEDLLGKQRIIASLRKRGAGRGPGICPSWFVIYSRSFGKD